MQGRVVSPGGGPEADVHIIVSGAHLQGTRETATDSHGFYQLLVLPPGTYELRAGRIGSRPILAQGIVVELGRTTAVPTLTLVDQPILMDSVVVVAPVSLDPVHVTMGGVLRAEDYTALPVDRDYKSIISILPHANESYRGDPVNVGGATGLENQYYIDGVSVTDSRWGNRATSLPYNFVRSVNVRSGGYEAQYGRALGAVVDAVTYSGTNQLEANVFGVTQPSSLTMDPKGAPVLREEGPVYHDFGGRVSGPLLRDRLWYSVALNPRRDKVNKEITGLGFFEDKTDAIRFANKLTWRASSTTNLEISVFGDPTTHEQVVPPVPPGGIATVKNPDPFLRRLETGGTNAALRVTSAPSDRLLLQGSIGRQWDRYSQEASRDSSESYVDYVEGSLEGGFGWRLHENRGRTSLSAQATLGLSRHTLVMGANYEDLASTSSQALRSLSRNDSSTWVEDVESYSGSFHNRSPAAFIQDSWRVTDQLALNAGLRWSGQYLIGASGITRQSFPHEWQPRAGFSWGLGSSGVQRVFGSFGRFYQTIPTNIAVIWFVDYFGLLSTYSTDPRQPGAVPVSVLNIGSLEKDVPNQIPGIEAENFDEFTLGYERVLGNGATVTLRGIRRDLRSSYQWGWDFSQDPPWVLGTPGEGDFDFLPPPKRQYTALEVSAVGAWKRLTYRTSYVLSRSWGNYPGLYNSEGVSPGTANPGMTSTFWAPYQAENSTGFLPNDQTHVFKLSTDYASSINVRLGAFLTVASGTPINDFVAGPDVPSWPSFRMERGTAGRTPALWNLDLRLAYDLPLTQGPTARLQLDVLHVGNPRETVQVDEWHYNTVDANGNPGLPNPNYKKPLQYQPPMAVRLGMEVDF